MDITTNHTKSIDRVIKEHIEKRCRQIRRAAMRKCWKRAARGKRRTSWKQMN